MVVYPLSGLFAATKAVQEVAYHLKTNGTTKGVKDTVDFSGFEEVIELQKYKDMESEFIAD